MSRTFVEPTLDIVFKHLLVSEPLLLHDMLESVLDRRVASFEVLDPDVAPEALDGKRVVLDLRVRLGDGEQVDIEMQTQTYPGLGRRFLLYWANLHASAAPRGVAYVATPRTISILWMARGIIDSPHFHSIFHVKDEATGLVLADTLEIHVLNLGSPREAERGALARWRRFFSYESDEALRSLAMSDPKMALAVERLEEMSQDKRWLSRADERRIDLQIIAMAQEDMLKAGLAEGERKGREMGRAEGREEGRAAGREEGRAAAIAEIARSFGLDDETVARLGGLPFAEASAELARLTGRR